jgi:diaminohydroxyphosphoribosylaminopyrimidine deaminase/5-amino-6-(5-phosphoribosylamino)uracil reductase
MKRIEERGTQVWVFNSKQDKVDLKACLSKLGEMGMMSLMVEGGSQINGSFLDEALVDKILLFLSPRLLGDHQALGIFGGHGAQNLSQAPILKDVRVRKVGGDLLIEAYLSKAT